MRRGLGPVTGDTLLAWHGARVVAMTYTQRVRDELHVFDVAENSLTLRRSGSPRRADREANVRAYVALDDRLALFSRNAESSLGVWDVEEARVVADVDLSMLRGASPEASPYAIVTDATHAFVTLQRLDLARLSERVRGAVAVVDLQSRALMDVDPSTPTIDAIELPLGNPFGQPALHDGVLDVPCAGALDVLGDGGVVRVNTRTLVVERTLVDELTLRGNPLHILSLDSDRLLIVVMTEPTRDGQMRVAATRLVEWSVTQQRLTRTWYEVPEYALTAPVRGSDGVIYVGDRGSEGLRRPSRVLAFNAHDGSLRDATGWSVGLPPYHLLAR